MPFSRFSLHADLLRAVKELGFLRPTPIQEQAIPVAMSGRDVLACAMTGSGKTAAFLLPILERLRGKSRGTTRALVVTPTRELAAQIHQHLEDLAVHTPLTGASVYGGVGMGPQEHAFRSGVDVIIATPGRLLDHLRHSYVRLGGLEVLVLDEADRMLDMGFLPDVRRILKQIPSNRQTLFFSATMPREIRDLSRDMLRDPVTVDLQRKSAPAIGVRHAVYPVARDLKSALLLEILSRELISDAIVFTRTKHRANRLAVYLEKHGVATGRIHGNRSQSQRTEALAGFKAGRHRILVATDIVSRGIDVEELGHVVNFDVPGDPDSYVHRVGRTARAEATGDAFTFVAPEEEPDLQAIERVLGKRLPRVTLPGFDYNRKTEERLEIPIRERLAAHRAQKHSARRTAGATAGSGGQGGGAGKPRRDAGRKKGSGSSYSSRRPSSGPPTSGQPGSGPPRPHQQSRDRSRDSRLHAILDRHAPQSEASRTSDASRAKGSAGRSRRRG